MGIKKTLCKSTKTMPKNEPFSEAWNSNETDQKGSVYLCALRIVPDINPASQMRILLSVFTALFACSTLSYPLRVPYSLGFYSKYFPEKESIPFRQ